MLQKNFRKRTTSKSILRSKTHLRQHTKFQLTSFITQKIDTDSSTKKEDKSAIYIKMLTNYI